MKNIQQKLDHLRRQSYGALAILMLAATMLMAFPMAQANAAGQLTKRFIKMGDSSPSGGTITTGIGSGTRVVYTLQFETTNISYAIGGIVIEFCQQSPIAGDSCTSPNGFATNSGTLGAYNQWGFGTGDFSVSTASSTTNKVVLTRATAVTPSATGSASAQCNGQTGFACLEMGNGTNGYTNPSNSTGNPAGTPTSFYARVYTFTTAALANGYDGSPSAMSTVSDNGGIALTTANVISITARVQESIIFCVFGAVAPNNNCAAAPGSTAPALSIGHSANGGSRFIDGSQVDTVDAYMQLSTNAGYGATINMRSNVTNAQGGGLVSGPNQIPAVNAGAGGTTPYPITAGQAAFGLIVFPGSSGIGVGAPITPHGNYYDAAHDTSGEGFYYGMDSTSTGQNTTSTSGDQIATTTGAVNNSTSKLTFAATASNLTPAGVYAANLSLIATGTF